ncbi:peptidoglycan/xylan/chitin deacetylase (PgdA/CDA1 family) [Natranaerovirga pectinivora]|uniref:Peptidoglycan/xylan/chitin deacetylase (PgdA/CDA1 family) n=1 Tax=Natranaerovirga pectinivora TaxID=682400 RepID=A0A4R3MPC4_9FIRM|nr:peptidoglycan/xylan/chitin deacetylase (PgdA/CDA1 family) [Natranaerovirga pectinivora]
MYGILFLGIIIMGYTVAPNFYVRNISKSIKHKLDAPEKLIALTFDDGPDERYTNEVLDILKEHNVKATFFVVARKVEKNKDIIHRMKAEEHEIGLHTLNHKSAWLMGPVKTLKEIKEAKIILENEGIELKYYRPPWGTFNLFTLISASKNKLKTILWSVNAYDWRKNNSPDKISKTLLDRIEKQSIIVLHDSGGAKLAPYNTIGALKRVIPILLEKGYKFVSVDK